MTTTAKNPTLSPRRIEILVMVAQGSTNKEIAKALQLSAKTVETHRADIARVLDIHGVANLTRYAIREGLVTP